LETPICVRLTAVSIADFTSCETQGGVTRVGDLRSGTPPYGAARVACWQIGYIAEMDTPRVQISGDGLRVDDAVSHPAGLLYSGGYDTVDRVLYLSSVMGHPRGVSLAGGEPAEDRVAGMRVLIIASSDIYWATDSMSLPRGLTEEEADAVQAALQSHFAGQQIRRVEKLEDAR
jgi:hypothetical protein